MKDFTLLSDEEYSLICAAIPYKIVTNYFKRNPKQFSKIRPGFRANAIKADEAARILARSRQEHFVSSFVERIASDWIDQILEAISSYQADGESENFAYIHALSQSFFLKNISAFFKLAAKDFSDEQISLFSDTVALLRDNDEKLQKSLEDLKTLSHELQACKKKREDESVEAKRKQTKSASQIDRLEKRIKDLQDIDRLYHQLSDDYTKLEKQNKEYVSLNISLYERISDLQTKIQELTEEKEKLEITIRKRIEEEQEVIATSKVFDNPLRPVDLEEFRDFLGYNINSIGSIEPQLSQLLSSYLSRILFYGKPIVCDKTASKTLIGCISNSLVGAPDYKKLQFTYSLSEKEIHRFIASEGRIAVLDNFVGNYNESILLSIVSAHKNKIVFLSVNNHKTIKYLSEDFLSFCNYIDVTKIPEFSSDVFPDEDPSQMEETEYVVSQSTGNNRIKSVFRGILRDLGYNDKIINSKANYIDSDQSLCEMLLFDIIPYYSFVLSKNPLNYSLSLQKYLIKSPFAALLKGWLDQ